MKHYRKAELLGKSVALSELMLAGLSLIGSATDGGYLTSAPTVTARYDADSGVLGYTVEVELIGKRI